MTKVEKFWQWVETRMVELNINSYRELEIKAGFKNGAINRRKNALKLPTVEVAEGMCVALKVNWIELWTKAGLVNSSDYPAPKDLSEIEAAIFRELSGKNNEFLSAVLKTVRAWGLYEDMKK